MRPSSGSFLTGALSQVVRTARMRAPAAWSLEAPSTVGLEPDRKHDLLRSSVHLAPFCRNGRVWCLGGPAVGAARDRGIHAAQVEESQIGVVTGWRRAFSSSEPHRH